MRITAPCGCIPGKVLCSGAENLWHEYGIADNIYQCSKSDKDAKEVSEAWSRVMSHMEQARKEIARLKEKG